MLAFILLVLSAGLLLFGAFGGSGNGRKAARRRMETMRARHVTGAGLETQMRRIAAQRATQLDERLHQLLPNPDLFRRRIAAAGKSWRLGQFAIGCAIVGAIVMVLLLVRGTPLLLTLLLGMLAGIGLPYWWIGLLGRRRLAKFLLRFPEAIELLVRGLRSGLPISETMQVVAGEIADPVGTEFRGVVDRMKIGKTMEAALQETADRLNTPEFQFFVITLAIQRETGGNLAETLGNLADVLRKRLQMKLKVKAMASESKASAWIIGALPFVVFALIFWINPTYMGKFLIDPRLIWTAAGGAMWMGIGVFIMAKMINFEI